MTRFLALLLIALLSLARVRPALAEDAAEGATAGASVEPSGDEAPADDAEQPEKSDKAEKPAKGAKKKKKKSYDYEQSKYKAYKELVAEDTHSYRFDARGNPIVAGSKKKKAAAGKKKKKAVEETVACDAGEPCQDGEGASEAKASVQPAD
jgi:hypothetical protein